MTENIVDDLKKMLDTTFNKIRQTRKLISPSLLTTEVGIIVSISTGVARVKGLHGAEFEEILIFSGGILGIVFNIDDSEISAVLLGNYWQLHAGDEVQRTGRVADIGVGNSLLGRVIDPLGQPLDGLGKLETSERLPIERPAALILNRSAVNFPLHTGIKVIDALIPIGRGQRELIIGDRQTGKTSIALDTIINQRDKNVLCVYCAIGQRASTVARSIATLKENGAMDYTVVMVTEGNNSPGLSYIAPYAATSVAEYFMETGQDVLIVYDDLTQHARCYRELSLLLRRPPGREAYPGDIFYLHSRLLERSTHLRKEFGGGSLTALPIIETQAQNISAYIPTNLISITDGQIYLSPNLFELGILPAIDVGKSVSRVGGKAQQKVFRQTVGSLKLAYSQFEELEKFAQFGAHLDAENQKIINHGQRIRSCLNQPERDPIPVSEQIIILISLSSHLFEDIPIEMMIEAQQAVKNAVKHIPQGIREIMQGDTKLSEDDKKIIIQIAAASLEKFKSVPSDKKVD